MVSEKCTDAMYEASSKVFGAVWAYTATQMNDPCLRLDLLIVADDKRVLHAYFYPSTGFGATSRFQRTEDKKYLTEQEETFTTGNWMKNNVFDLFDEEVSGTYAFEITSNNTDVLMTSCASCVKTDAGIDRENCRQVLRVKN